MSKAASWMRRMSRKRKRNDIDLSSAATENIIGRSDTGENSIYVADDDQVAADATDGIMPNKTNDVNLEASRRPLFKDEILSLSLDELIFLRAVSKDNAKLIPDAVEKWMLRKIIMPDAQSDSVASPSKVMSLFDRFNTVIGGEDKLLQLWLLRPNFKQSVVDTTSNLLNEYVPMTTQQADHEGIGVLDYSKALASLLAVLKGHEGLASCRSTHRLDNYIDGRLVEWLDARDALVSVRECGMPTNFEYSKLFANVPVDVCHALALQKQGTDTWLRSRKWLLTGSAVAAVVDHNPYNTWHETVLKILKSEKETHDAKTLCNFKYGHDNEPHARAYLTSWFRARPELYADFEMYELGMVLGQWCDEVYGFAYSPDGIVRYTDSETRRPVWALIEYKCPALAKRPYARMPAYYFDQVQMGMGLFGMTRCFFVAWSPLNGVSVQIIPFNSGYFENIVLLRARNRIKSVLLTHDTVEAEQEAALTPAITNLNPIEGVSLSQAGANQANLTNFSDNNISIGIINQEPPQQSMDAVCNIEGSPRGLRGDTVVAPCDSPDGDVTDDNDVIIDEYFYETCDYADNESIFTDTSERNFDYECEYE